MRRRAHTNRLCTPEEINCFKALAAQFKEKNPKTTADRLTKATVSRYLKWVTKEFKKKFPGNSRSEWFIKRHALNALDDTRCDEITNPEHKAILAALILEHEGKTMPLTEIKETLNAKTGGNYTMKAVRAFATQQKKKATKTMTVGASVSAASRRGTKRNAPESASASASATSHEKTKRSKVAASPKSAFGAGAGTSASIRAAATSRPKAQVSLWIAISLNQWTYFSNTLRQILEGERNLVPSIGPSLTSLNYLYLSLQIRMDYLSDAAVQQDPDIKNIRVKLKPDQLNTLQTLEQTRQHVKAATGLLLDEGASYIPGPITSQPGPIASHFFVARGATNLSSDSDTASSESTSSSPPSTNCLSSFFNPSFFNPSDDEDEHDHGSMADESTQGLF